MIVPTTPRVPRQPVARQPIWSRDGLLHGYEFLYRSVDGLPAQVDEWAAEQQDGASAQVLGTVFGDDLPADRALAFVNITRAFLVSDRPLPSPADRLVLEIVESVHADPAVLRGLRRLRALGYRVAIDDFVGTPHQNAMLPLADYVKIDWRDLERVGPDLVERARSHGAWLVAERVSEDEIVDRCTALGFDFLQGNALGPALTSQPWAERVPPGPWGNRIPTQPEHSEQPRGQRREVR